MINRTQVYTKQVAMVTAATVGGLSLAVLVGGWLLDVQLLRAWLPFWSPMAPFTAVIFVLLAAAVIWFRERRTLANLCLAVTFVLSLLIFAEWVTPWRLGFESLMIELGDLHKVPTPELPALDTLLAFMMIVVALACLRTANRWLHDFADLTVIVIATICLQVLIGYAYNIEASIEPMGFRQIAPASTILMILIAFSAAAWRPTPGLIDAIAGDRPSSLLLRRLLPGTLVVSVLFGSLLVIAIRSRLGPTPDLIAWAVTGYVVVLSLVLFVTSAEMRKAEELVEQRQEELLAAKTAAEAASEAKSRFMAVMSHELRTPLTSVIGYTELIDEGVAGVIPPEASSYVQRVRASGWHLLGLIDSVLYYASGKLPTGAAAQARVNLTALTREVVRMFETHARDKNLTLEFTAPEAPVFAITDAQELRQILMNLLSNAVKFTERGRIDVRLRTTDHVIIDVADTGIGIDAEHLAHIWEPFSLVDATHTRARGGMGLGLALAQRLAEQIKARLTVRSEVGVGSTFTLELPVPAQTAADTELNGVHVLIVDDEPSLLRVMARTLARTGAVVTEAESAQAALAVLGNGSEIDVIVTDISMPDMNGIQLARVIRERWPALPLLFVTGAELDDQDLDDVRALGGQLLTKPFETGALARTVRSLLP